jgi:hypothetical protein
MTGLFKNTRGLVLGIVLAGSFLFGCMPGPITATDLNGFWSGDWGDMVLKVTDSGVRGAYSHDDGTLQGTFD